MIINYHFGRAANYTCIGLKENEAQKARAESTHKGVNQRSKDVTQTQQQNLSRLRYLSPGRPLEDVD